jgi:hypothetical protein
LSSTPRIFAVLETERGPGEVAKCSTWPKVLMLSLAEVQVISHRLFDEDLDTSDEESSALPRICNLSGLGAVIPPPRRLYDVC